MRVAGIGVVVVAAGRGERFGGPLPKQYCRLGDRPVLAHTVEALLADARLGPLVVVIDPAHRAFHDLALARWGGDGRVLPPVAGGATRQDSVRAGLEALAGLPDPPALVLIHDAARPLVAPDLIERVLAALAEAPGAVASLPVTDTLRRAADGLSAGTVPRDGLWRAQTPQGFRFAPILAAHRAAAGQALTDDVAVAESAGLGVRIVEGAAEALKITTAEDLRLAELLLAARRTAPPRPAPFPDLRTGTGFDVHRLIPGEAVTLCGVVIPHDQRLEGHSDADVGLHALTDALLGAIGAGDIGVHFPPSDPQWKGADSARFLRHAADLVTVAGGRILNVDVTLLCERPRIGPHRAAMVTRMAAILGLETGRVSVKATTTERLGFTGRGEGIAAQAAASVLMGG